ncbi:MAG: HD domain-containing protein, partial [Candidatus Micrarchaeia archaeon]
MTSKHEAGKALKIPAESELGMKIPTIAECLKLLDETKLTSNMKRHSMLVMRISTALAKKLMKKGETINLELLRSAALLHDLDKFLTLENGHEHGYLSQKILTEKGYPEVGQIVRKHRLETIYEDPEGLKTWEEKLVFYADKRLNDSTIVGLPERYDYLLKRYGTTPKRREAILRTRAGVESLENEIFSKIGRSPDELIEIMKEEG